MQNSFALKKTGLIDVILAVTAGFLFSHAAGAAPRDITKVAPMAANEKARELKDVGIDEKLGTQIDMSLQFKNEKGQDVTLGSYFDGKTPVIISPVYYSCPGLCNFHLNGLTEALKNVDWSPGTKFQVVAVSFDPKETPDVADKKKENYMKVYSRPGTENGWHFLTGNQENVTKFTQMVGFKYKWNEEEKEWAHASAAIVVSPNGKITRYLPGIMFEPKDVKLALTEAGEGKVGTFVDQLVLYCFQYSPHQSRYTLYAFNIMKAGGAIMMLALLVWLLPVWIRSRKERAQARS